ncbi:molecular chaperone HtpG [Rhodoplanes sp. TEM]|uniref:Chaperone protein HtpG n=1 Tax=Rhodoplanes tepidamans TaxID=200616 RepID=A0ABT5J652_RHOTP|nr:MULTISPECIES: molecular chaperone HtpG [Rhodoplanes]MDC7784912.1 molecular chaperone HtpG [Rhodoplanes tepidamans]MDC7983992.1 molecular chaperone HtpG [Rhodoplanes sp. TEM]MDQ0353859.1 molecular chaperone HtpG [Rhodoplanes tepidamans]
MTDAAPPDASEATPASPAPHAEVHPFQAEVAELLHLMVHSVYSETDVFLRELISNASDACDRLRYEAIARPELLADDPDLKIRITPDKAAGTLTVADNGVGMDRQELIDNLGTIARSGTRAFIARLAEAKDGGGLIGQFGVGFYAAFMVADRIEVTSRRAGADEAFVWRSTGSAGFEVEPAGAHAAALPRGTEIVLHLKEDARKYLEPWEIERVVHAYSDHIQFPIMLAVPAGKADGDEADEAKAGDEKAGEPRQINTASAVWQRSKSELKPEDYTQAYRSICGAFDEPAVTLHYRAEGRQSYAVLLFVPSSSMFDLYDPARKSHLKLYVRRVYITDDASLLPSWLRFVRGVVDSEDLPLNLSREMLQNNPQVAAMRKAITGKVLSELESVASKDADRFATVWETFGAVIKEGLYEEPDRREQILGLARFTSTRGERRTLAQYVAELRENQTEIYYLAGEDLDRLKANPKLEAAKARGIEVLLLTDPVDALWTSLRLDFQGKGFKSLSQGEVDFSLVPLAEEARAEAEKAAETAVDEASVIAAVKLALGDRVSDVKASQRLTDSAACLVAGGFGPDRELERLLAKQNRSSGTRPVLELNMRHALVGAVARESGAGHAHEAADLAMLLFEQAQILDGELPDDPAAFAMRLNRLVTRGLAAH